MLPEVGSSLSGCVANMVFCAHPGACSTMVRAVYDCSCLPGGDCPLQHWNGCYELEVPCCCNGWFYNVSGPAFVICVRLCVILMIDDNPVDGGCHSAPRPSSWV